MRWSQVMCRGGVSDLTKKYSNLPEEYIKRSMEQVYWRTPRGVPQYLPRDVARKKFRFTTNRPWSSQFAQQNAPGFYRKKIFIEPVKEWSYFRGDRVEVLVGRDKGKQGIVTQVFPERNWVIVEGLNTHLRTVAKDKKFTGLVIKSESPLLVTNQVSLVDPSDLQSSEVEWRFTEAGEKVRVSVRSGRIIPIPSMNDETYDYKAKGLYKESPKDTPASEISEITFSPTLATFEMDIMNQLKIEETREPAPSYWY